MNEKEKELAAAQAEEMITKQALLTEIAAAIGDLFVAEVKQEEDGLRLEFLNGQQFALTVNEL
ncbi:MAG: hypothetical protein IIX02_02185 [Clostridia bacterium]|jgi:hypothetical protein|nr:hypothetical protein [Clostridia bacterium]